MRDKAQVGICVRDVTTGGYVCDRYQKYECETYNDIRVCVVKIQRQVGLCVRDTTTGGYVYERYKNGWA